MVSVKMTNKVWEAAVRHKKILLLFVILGCMFMLTGCAYYNTSFDFDFDGDYMADKYVDLLIPIDESDERYTDLNDVVLNGESSDDLRNIPKDSEIVTYSKDGYRSMLMHMKGARLDTAFNGEGSDGNSGIINEVYQRVYLPQEWHQKNRDPHGEEAFLEFCDKYKKARAAVFDSEGNILHISKKFSLSKLGYSYIYELEYDISADKIICTHIESSEVFAFRSLMSLISVIGTLILLILLIVHEFFNYITEKGSRGYIIIAVMICIPSALSILLRMTSSIVCAPNLLKGIMEIFISLLSLITISCIFNFLILRYFIKSHKSEIVKAAKYKEQTP